MPSLKWMRPEGRPKIFSIYKTITSIGRASVSDVCVVAHVDEAEQLAARQERRAHHARELEVHHALASTKARVVHRIGDDERLPALGDPVEDRVRELLDRRR